jgi:SAM-dependent methyltransferase
MKPFGEDGPSLRELLDQALSSTERGYDMLAPRFDATPFRTPDAVVEGTLATMGGGDQVDDALDLCCGTGGALAALLPRTRRRLVGVDFSEGMLDAARARLGAALEGEAPRVELLRRDVFAIDFDAEFDLVTCFGAFGHIPVEAEPRFVRLVRRALRPGGRFVFVTGVRPSRWSRSHLFSSGFNAAMRARNAIVSPPFIMYYLTFLLPEVARLLRWEGFEVAVQDEVPFAPPFDRLKLVVATRPR